MIDISKIKVHLYLSDNFLGCIASSIKIEKDDKCPTACTDGLTIHYNESFFSSLNFNEQVGVIAHECGHIALAHALRFKQLNHDEKQQMIWNIAADYVVNNIIQREGFVLPKGHLECPYRYNNESTEVIYKDLLENAEIEKITYPDLSEGNGNSNEQENKSASALQEEISSLIYKAHMGAANMHNKNFSTMCSECARTIANMLRPKLNWRVLLRNFVNDFKPCDYSWAKPNRRIQDFYLPSLCGLESDIKSVNVYVDNSGSIGDTELNQFMSELKRLFEDLELDYMDIRAFSIGLDSLHHITNSDTLRNIKFNSMGGTEIESVVEDLNASKAMFSIILTDGYYCQEPVKYIKRKVFWVIYDNEDYKPEKGKVAHISV